MKMVMIDTCAWIDFFKSKTGDLGNLVGELIETNQAAITGVVVTELLQGVKQEKESLRLKRLFHAIHYLPTEDGNWFNAGTLLGNVCIDSFDTSLQRQVDIGNHFLFSHIWTDIDVVKKDWEITG